MPIFYNDMPLNKAILLNQMSDPTVGNAPPKEPEPVPWSPTDHPVFMPPEDMYMLTGDYPNYDPAGSPLKKDGTDTFTSRNAQLVEKLQAMSQSNPKVQFEPCKGRYDNKDEQSVLLKGMPLNDVMKLAKEHGQASIVHLPPYPAANRMVYVNGPHANEHEHGIRENTKTFASPPSDAYSFIPSLGKYLRLDFNWGNYHPNESQDSCPEDTGGPQEPAMKSEKTVTDVTKAIANLLKKEIKEHEDFLVELRKADKCGKCGKSPCACKGVEKCSKCGDMMKMDKCSKCDMSDVSKSEKDIVEIAQFFAVMDAMSKAEEKKGAKRLQDEPQSLTDGGEGPKKIPESKEVAAPGSGDDAKAGKVEKAASMKKSIGQIKGEKGEESSKSKEESSSKEKSKEESSSISKSLDLMIDLVKAFDHKAPMPHAAHAAPAVGLPAHAPVAKGPALHAHPAGAAIPSAAVHGHPMAGKLDALKAQAASMKKPKIPSVK